MRKLTETIEPANSIITLKITSDDGLEYTETVEVVDDHVQFERNIKSARTKLVNKRVWLNARKALTKEEILRLDQGE